MRKHLNSSGFKTAVTYASSPGKFSRPIISFIKFSSFKGYTNVEGDWKKEPCCARLELKVLIYDSVNVCIS